MCDYGHVTNYLRFPYSDATSAPTDQTEAW